MSIRSSLPLLLLLVLPLTVAGCGEEAPTAAQAPAPPAIRHPLVRALDDADPDVRTSAAETLGRSQNASRPVIDALLEAQWDEDESVAEAAVAALNRLQPGPKVAILVPRGTSYESVVEVMVRPAFTTWQEIDCEPASGMEGEQRVACWRLVEVPPVFETRIRQAQPLRLVWRDAGKVRSEEAVRAKEIAAVRAAPLPPEVPPINRVVPPQGEPEGAQPGEVWCRHESASGGTWRRHPECEVPSAQR